MKHKSYVAMIFGVTLSGVALAQPQPLPSGPSSSPSGGRPQSVSEQLNYRQRQLSDEKFIQEAASANLTQVEMSKLALDKSSDPKIRGYAEKTVAKSAQNDAELRQLAASRQIMVPAQPSADAQRELNKLQGKSGDKFDESFVKSVKQDREKNVSLFSTASKSNSLDPELRVYAANTLPALETQQRKAGQLKRAVENEPSEGPGEGYSSQSLSPTPLDE